MNSHEQNVASAFNKAATTYNQHDDLQTAVGCHLIQTLIDIKHSFKRVIDAGCGTGFITTKLANTISYASFVALDIADALLQNTRHLPDNIIRRHDSFDKIGKNNDHYDLIFSNLALHWSRNLPDTLQILRDALNADGLLAFSIPLSGTLSELEPHFSTHKFNTMTEIKALLASAGLNSQHYSSRTFSYSFLNTLSALRSMKLTGTHYVANRDHHLLRGKASLPTIKQLSYQVGFFIVSK